MLRQHCSSDYCQRLLREQSIFSNMLSRQPWQSVGTDIVPRESLPLASLVEQRQPTVTTGSGSRLGVSGGWMGIQVAPSEADSRALTADEFASRLGRIGDERYHHQHPFHLLMYEGRLTSGQLQAWALNRYYYQSRVPMKDAIVLSRSEDPTIRVIRSTAGRAGNRVFSKSSARATSG